MSVVVMAETRQQAIEKASAELSAKLPGVLGQVFREDDDRRFAQLGPDILDDMEELPEKMTVAVVVAVNHASSCHVSPMAGERATAAGGRGPGLRPGMGPA